MTKRIIESVVVDDLIKKKKKSMKQAQKSFLLEFIILIEEMSTKNVMDTLEPFLPSINNC